MVAIGWATAGSRSTRSNSSPFFSIDGTDVRRAGETDLASLRRRAAHAGPIADDTLVYRIEFHPVD